MCNEKRAIRTYVQSLALYAIANCANIYEKEGTREWSARNMFAANISPFAHMKCLLVSTNTKYSVTMARTVIVRTQLKESILQLLIYMYEQLKTFFLHFPLSNTIPSQ